MKGYEIAKEQYGRISQEDLDPLEASASDAMQILEFVPLSAVARPSLCYRILEAGQGEIGPRQ